MEEWKEYKLEEVCAISSSKRIFANEYQNTGIPFYRGKEIIEKHNGVNISNELYISEEKYNEIKTKFGAPKKGDMLLSSVGTLGVPYIVRDETFYFKDGNLTWFYNYKGINNYFLYYWFHSPKARFYIDTKAIGSTQKALTIETLKKFEILLPSLAEQDKIVAIIKSLDDKIEVNRKINENLEQQAQALFKSWFVDFEPFKDGEFVESELGMIPKGWKLKRIYEYVDIIYGAPYKSSLFNDNKEGHPLIRIRDLKTNTPQFYTPEILPNTEYVDAGDIVAGMDAEFTPYVWQGERGVLNQRCCKFKGKYEGISNYFILFLIKPELEYVQSYKTGTTVSHLGKSDIDRFVFLTPPLDIVLAFSEKVNPMIKEVVNRAKESRRLETLRDTLLPKLMSGELRVNGLNN